MKALLIFALFTTSIFASKIKVTDVAFEDQGKEGKMVISLEEKLDDFPELVVKNNFVQVVIPGSFVWPKIEKSFTVANNFDSKLMAYQFDKNRVRVRAVLPNQIEDQKTKVALQLKGKNIVVTFPKQVTKQQNVVGRAPAINKKQLAQFNAGKAPKASADSYDESYLDKLLKQKEENIKLDKKPAALGATEKAPSVAEDKVNLALSGQKKEAQGFSLTSYVGKFVGFLALVLLLFYGVVTLMKKGAFNKSKLGFLNSTKIIEVLNTTYIGPKRSMLLIRAHNQVFLVGSSEKGLHMISEIKDTNGLFKEGEKQISGSNFDTTLGKANEAPKDFKLKDFLAEAPEETTEESEENIALKAIEKEMYKAKESQKVKFSDQIKSKLKDLKPLQ